MDLARLRPKGPTLLRIAIFLLLVSPAAIFGTAQYVLHKADQIAQDSPFCVQIAGPTPAGNYQQVRSLWQLTFLAMHARYQKLGGSDSFQFTYHGVLVVDRKGAVELRHWSWQKFNWLPISDDPRDALGIFELACKPQPDFNDSLSMI